MVAPLIAAGARVAAGSAGRSAATGAAGSRAAMARPAAPSATTPAAGGRAGGFGPMRGYGDGLTDSLQAIVSPQWPVRVGNLPAALILLGALSVDALQALLLGFNVIPAIGTAIALLAPPIIGVVGAITITMAFGLCGVSFFSGKRALQKAAATLAPFAAEVVPLFSTMPALTGGAVATFVISRLEDRELHFEAEMRQARLLQARAVEARWQAGQAANAGNAAVLAARERQAAEAEAALSAFAGGEDPGLDRARPGDPKAKTRRARLIARQDLPHELPLPDYRAGEKTQAGIKPSEWR